jgi:hypothetical protein
METEGNNNLRENCLLKCLYFCVHMIFSILWFVKLM